MGKKIQTQIPMPSKSKGKGVPPKTEYASNNLSKPLDEELVALNFRVPAEFRRRIKQYALDYNITSLEVMMKAVEKYINANVK
jgi:hypothetical protein